MNSSINGKRQEYINTLANVMRVQEEAERVTELDETIMEIDRAVRRARTLARSGRAVADALQDQEINDRIERRAKALMLACLREIYLSDPAE